jgi:hypothetical protein
MPTETTLFHFITQHNFFQNSFNIILYLLIGTTVISFIPVFRLEYCIYFTDPHCATCTVHLAIFHEQYLILKIITKFKC